MPHAPTRSSSLAAALAACVLVLAAPAEGAPPGAEPASALTFTAGVLSTQVGSRRVQVTWSFAQPDPAVTLHARRRLDSDTEWTVVGGPWAASATTLAFTDSTVAGGTAYHYELLAESADGANETGEVALATLAPARLIQCTILDGQVTLVWTAVRGITQYPLYKRLDGGTFGWGGTLYSGFSDAVRYTYYTEPCDSVAFRLTWQEFDGRHAAPDLVIHFVQRTATPSFSLAGSDRALLVWTVPSPDPLFPSHADRLLPDGTWMEVGVLEPVPYSADRFQIDATGLSPSTTYTFRARWWTGPGEAHGAEITVHTRPVPVSPVVRARPDRVAIRWRLTEAAAFRARLERRTGTGEWTYVAPAESRGDSVVAIDALAVPGPEHAWRLAWDELDGTLHSEPVTGRVPELAVSLASFEATPVRVRTRWKVSEVDPAFPIHVLRRAAGADVSDTLGLLPTANEAGERVFDDTTAAYGRCAYRLAWTTTAGPQASAEAGLIVPGPAFTLERPEPNPARGEVSVAFAIPDQRHARLELLDVAGRRRLASTFAGPGGFRWTIPAGTVRPGVYFVRCTAPGFAATRRIVIAP